jgi:hypothetical protein
MKRRVAIIGAALIAAAALATAYWVNADTTLLGSVTTRIYWDDDAYHGEDGERGVYRHEHHAVRASWQGPGAVFIAITGLGVSATVLPLRRRTT